MQDSYRDVLMSPVRRRELLLDAARTAARAIRAINPEARVVVFGSCAREPARVGVNSDLDLAVFETWPEDQTAMQRSAYWLKIIFPLVAKNHEPVPIDLVVFRRDGPDGALRSTILREGMDV